jgi:hypothetical protein
MIADSMPLRRHPHPDPPPQAGEGEERSVSPLAAFLPLPLAGEVDALEERGGWGKSLGRALCGFFKE